ncbi:MAG: helix-turn-helix domain-containing protein [Bacteroidetes bacterium]|nr:helix-turn-helix domain-containing protein [Bacteroidota bacterium]
MTGSNSTGNDFLSKVTGIIEENISNERFGVSELAQETGMSRSNLLRKIQKATKLSVSQFIRQVRLKKAMEILRQSSSTVSEVSYKVGFSSTSYFVKCFHDYYGYPPGEVGKRDPEENNSIVTGPSGKRRLMEILGTISFIVLFGIVLLIIFKPFSTRQQEIEKSIAVLPFKNNSNDSTNVYIINGLMESILNNLQNIRDLSVTSRTSVEKYRNSSLLIPEIARELNVSYFVEGSGQKIGDQILLNIQLIEASSDRHIWSEQYKRKVEDIFDLQMEVAKQIADEIEAIITPEEKERIEKPPTDNLVAYDYFLKGLDLLNNPAQDKLEEAILYFNKAIEIDSEFARAYAAIAIAYYLMDQNQAEKKYSDQINNYADIALLYDSQLAQSLIAKALFYMTSGEYELAVSYFEKALEYNPNSDLVYLFLVDLYANYLPDTEKYLEYALKGIKIDIAAYDSITVSYTYLHISNAFLQSGFIIEAEKYINKSLDYYPENLYSQYVKPYILYAANRDLLKTKELLIEVFKKDTNRLDVMQEVGKICYYMRDYKAAYDYYNRFIDIKRALNLDIYPGENAKIGVVFSKMGLKEESERMFSEYKEYADNDRSIYKHLSLACYYSFKGEIDQAIENMRLFSEQHNYHYWTVTLLKIDPLIDNIIDHPEFNNIMNALETRFWDYHKEVRAALEEKGLL